MRKRPQHLAGGGGEIPAGSHALQLLAWVSHHSTYLAGSSPFLCSRSSHRSYFDVLYVADPSRDWYGGGSEAAYAYYRSRLAATTRSYRRVLMLGDSMGATACLLFADLATAALAFCPQVRAKTPALARWIGPCGGGTPGLEEMVILPSAVREFAAMCAVLDRRKTALLNKVLLLPPPLPHAPLHPHPPQVDLTTASIRPGRPAEWFASLKRRLMASVAAFGGSGGGGSADGLPAPDGTGDGGGQLVVLVGTWAHDLDQANMLPHATQQQQAAVADASAAGRQQDRARRAARSAGWRDAGAEPQVVGAAVHRSPWAWQQGGEGSGASSPDSSSLGVNAEGTGAGGGVVVKVFNVDSHRLAAALDAQGQLTPLIRSAVLAELSLRGAIVRVSNLL